MVAPFSQNSGPTLGFDWVGFPSYSRNSFARQNMNKLLEVEYQV